MPRTDSLFSEEEETPHNHARRELVMAARAYDKPRVRQLFETTPLDADDATKYLVWALPDLPMMRFLLERGADANSFGIRSTCRRSLDVLKLLAEFGFDVKSEGHIILQDFADCREDLEWLLDQGVDASLTDLHRQDTGIRLGGLVDHSLKVLNNIAKTGDIELFDYVVSRGADPLRSTALHAVSLCRDIEKMAAMMDHLLDHHHMDIEASNDRLRESFGALPDSGSPLISAIYHENFAAVKKLLHRGASARGVKRSLVAQAIGHHFFGGFLPALGPLLDAGADVDHAFMYALCRNNIDAAKICFERGADPTHSLEKWERMIEREARRMRGSESGEEDSEVKVEELDEEQEEEDEEEAESRNRMRVFLETISNAAPSMA